MLAVLTAAPREAKLALICAHPELAGKEAAAGTMTADSVGEQASAGWIAARPTSSSDCVRATPPIARSSAFRS